MAVNIRWLNASDGQISSINFGTIIVGGSSTQTFKIENIGDSIAESVKVKCVGSDEAQGWKQYKLGSGSYAAELALPNIAQNAKTELITVKSDVPVNATLGSHSTTTEVSYVYS